MPEAQGRTGATLFAEDAPHQHGAWDHLILYDGICALCNRLNLFVLARDRQERFGFAPLQSDLAGSLLRRHGLSATDLDSFHVVIDHGRSSERVLKRGRGALWVTLRLTWPWKIAAPFWLVPGFILNIGYWMVARTRYRIFGTHAACPLPAPEHRARFAEVEATIAAMATRASDSEEVGAGTAAAAATS